MNRPSIQEIEHFFYDTMDAKTPDDWMAKTMSQTDLDELKRTEDEVEKMVHPWEPLKCAVTYLYLNNTGMNINRALEIIAKFRGD